MVTEYLGNFVNNIVPQIKQERDEEFLDVNGQG